MSLQEKEVIKCPPLHKMLRGRHGVAFHGCEPGMLAPSKAVKSRLYCFANEKGATIARNPLIYFSIWLLDLGSNQGPTD